MKVRLGQTFIVKTKTLLNIKFDTLHTQSDQKFVLRYKNEREVIIYEIPFILVALISNYPIIYYHRLVNEQL